MSRKRSTSPAKGNPADASPVEAATNAGIEQPPRPRLRSARPSREAQAANWMYIQESGASPQTP